MANLFIEQAKQYAGARPSYPPELFQFIASKTREHDLAWDVGTGSGQAARSLAEIYKNVVATDTSPKQLEFATKLPNIRYQHTSPAMSTAELEQFIAAESSVDLVTIAQAMHWLDLPVFYQQVKWVLKKPHGVIAAWCYTTPEVNDAIDEILQRFYRNPYWDPRRKLVDDKYMSIDFPFEPVDGADSTGPFEFKSERSMGLEDYFTYLRSWSAYQTAKEKGVELLSDDVIEDFKRAWSEDGNNGLKLVNYPVYLRIGELAHWFYNEHTYGTVASLTQSYGAYTRGWPLPGKVDLDSKEWQVSIKHICRQVNQAADVMAKLPRNIGPGVQLMSWRLVSKETRIM